MAFSWTNTPKHPLHPRNRPIPWTNSSPDPLPSMKQGTFMDKHTKTFPPSTKQADSMDKLLPGPPSVHETRHFHGQTPGPRLHRHRAGGASPLAKLAQPALSGWPAYSPAALPPPPARPYYDLAPQAPPKCPLSISFSETP